MIVKEKLSKTILSKSQVYDYVINPYVGCQHACSYCYASFMKRFTGHKEPWGEFVDVKINAAELLQKEILKKRKAPVWVSGVCDPYQPLEGKYQLTRKCLEILAQNDWPVSVQTRSPLVLRDLDIFKGAKNFEVGMSITTANDDMRRLFEPHAPPIEKRIQALGEIHRAGVRTFCMIAPMLPDSEELPALLAGKVDRLLLDRMNYTHANWIYKQHGLQDKLTDGYFDLAQRAIASECRKLGIDCRITYQD